YGYFNQGFGSFTVSHTVRIYDSVGNPSGTHPRSVGGSIVSNSTIFVGPLAGTGAFSVVLSGLSIQVGHAAWISFDESVPNGGRTFRLTGGNPSVGSSHDGLGYFNHGVYYGWAASPLAFTGVIANQAMTISGTKVPGPSVIALLGLSGLVTLSRRRRK
ncbi:MAG: PEP-CTERM sorting domain-containing protein, partial [Gemmatimonadetes bacterium]|nr:PEP-CTERM sorting domain-containing protein [Gemmatimonadota bacterium]